MSWWRRPLLRVLRPGRAWSFSEAAVVHPRFEETPPRYVRDLAPARWIGERLHPFAQDAGSVIPEGFEDYARIFHPARRDAPERAVTWREVATANGRTVHAEMQFREHRGDLEPPQPTARPLVGRPECRIAAARARPRLGERPSPAYGDAGPLLVRRVGRMG